MPLPWSAETGEESSRKYKPTPIPRPPPRPSKAAESRVMVPCVKRTPAPGRTAQVMQFKRTDADMSLSQLVRGMSAEAVEQLSIKARQDGRLNEAFAIIVEMTTASRAHRVLVAETLGRTIQHLGDITGFVAFYWAKGSRLLSKQVKLGLARAFTKFSEREFAEHCEDRSGVKLRDVIALVHPKPMNREQGSVFAKLCNKTLPKLRPRRKSTTAKSVSWCTGRSSLRCRK
jgi:hypothetical protein